MGCKKPYNPPAITTSASYLVVEGIINAGSDSTIIKLSRTVNLADSVTLNPEKGATVFVEGDQNVSYPLKDFSDGSYRAAPLNLDNSHKYRLRITAADGKVSLSDFTGVNISPPIDSLWYVITGNGLKIYSNTHDPANNTHYYRWDYTETYIYQSPLFTYYKFQDGKAVLRKPNEYVYTCYVTDNSSTIVLNTSAKLRQDVISENLVTQIPSTSEKLYHRYSILLKQYALTAAAYNYWAILKKNTEQLGNIFDALPAQSNGNIHCITNTSEPVIGYISAGTVSKKRIFIDVSQLPPWPLPFVDNCAPYYISWPQQQGIPPYLTEHIQIPLGPIIGNYSTKVKDTVEVVQVGDYYCVDCTYHGTNIMPSFWK